jgi:prevent-host-death family protein
MPTQVNVHAAKSRLSELLQRVLAGEEIVIARDGEPIARLVPFVQQEARSFGADAGRFSVPEDFDAPLPLELVAAFYK